MQQQHGPQLGPQGSGSDQQQPPYLVTYLAQLQQKQQQQQQQVGEQQQHHVGEQQQQQQQQATHHMMQQQFSSGHTPAQPSLHDPWSMIPSRPSGPLPAAASGLPDAFPGQQPETHRSPFDTPFTVGLPKSPSGLKPPSGGASVTSDHDPHHDGFALGAPSESASVTSDVTRLATAVDKADAIVPPPPRNKERNAALAKPTLSETSLQAQDVPPRGQSPFAQQAQQEIVEVSEPAGSMQTEVQMHARQESMLSRDDSVDGGPERTASEASKLEPANLKPSRKQRRKQAHQANSLKDELPSLPQQDKPAGMDLQTLPRACGRARSF